MATSLLFSPPSAHKTLEHHPESNSSTSISLKSSFLYNTHFTYALRSTNLRNATTVRGRNSRFPTTAKAEKSLSLPPQQFGEETLEEEPVEEYEYGLSPKLLQLFMKEHNPFNQLSAKFTEERLSDGSDYDDSDDDDLDYRGRKSMVRGENSPDDDEEFELGPGMIELQEGKAPDLSSHRFNSRIIYIAWPIDEDVADNLRRQFLYLAFFSPKEPIYVYICSSGLLDEDEEVVGDESDAFLIADLMSQMEGDVYTVNLGWADNHAAMLLSLGTKGKRFLMPRSFVDLDILEIPEIEGTSSEIWGEAKLYQRRTDSYLELLSEGIGKPKEEIYEDIKDGRGFTAEEAIEYGIADKILDPEEPFLFKQNMIVESKPLLDPVNLPKLSELFE